MSRFLVVFFLLGIATTITLHLTGTTYRFRRWLAEGALIREAMRQARDERVVTIIVLGWRHPFMRDPAFREHVLDELRGHPLMTTPMFEEPTGWDDAWVFLAKKTLRSGS